MVAEIFHFTTYLGDTLVPLTKLASIAMLAFQVSIPQPVPPGINCNIHPSSLNCFVSHLCPNCNAGLPASIATLTFPASTTTCPSSRNCIASHLSLNCYCGPPNLNYSSGPLTSIAMLVLLTSIIEQYPPTRINILLCWPSKPLSQRWPSRPPPQCSLYHWLKHSLSSKCQQVF